MTAVFDGAGQRVANKAGGVMNIMVYDAGGKLVAEYGATAPTTTKLQYVTADYQGSTRVVTNGSGAVVNRHDYLPFGEDIGAGVGSRTTGKSFSQFDSVRQKYAGMETDDATGMATTLWRKQDNLSGRWTSPDPYGGSMTLADPQSFNRYTYCNNDPVNQVDPSGLYPNDYHGADSGWQDVAGYFWGIAGPLYGGRSFGASHMNNAEARHDSMVNEARTLQSFWRAYDNHDFDGAKAIMKANPSIGFFEEQSSDQDDSPNVAAVSVDVVGGDPIGGAGSPPQCFCQLKYRPTSPGSPVNHAFWWVKGSDGIQVLVQAGPSMPNGGFLNAWVTPVNEERDASELHASVAFSSGLSSRVCKQVDMLLNKANGWHDHLNDRRFAYDYRTINSNTAARYFGEHLFPITEPPNVMGWNTPIRPYAH